MVQFFAATKDAGSSSNKAESGNARAIVLFWLQQVLVLMMYCRNY
jgi:hypothetical protein